MVAVVGFVVFAAALAASLAVFAYTLAPALPRIVAMMRDGGDPALVPARAVIVTEPRLRARIVAAPVLHRAPVRAAA